MSWAPFAAGSANSDYEDQALCRGRLHLLVGLLKKPGLDDARIIIVYMFSYISNAGLG